MNPRNFFTGLIVLSFTILACVNSTTTDSPTTLPETDPVAGCIPALNRLTSKAGANLRSEPAASRLSPPAQNAAPRSNTALDSSPYAELQSYSNFRPDDLFSPTIQTPNFSNITLKPLANGKTEVKGAPGAIPGEYPVLVASPNTASVAATRAEADGSFVAQIAAPPGSWVIVKYDPTPGANWIRSQTLTTREGGKLRIESAQDAPGSWGMVPIPPDNPGEAYGEGLPFVVSGTATTGRDGFVDFTLRGQMSGDSQPGGCIKLAGTATISLPKDEPISLQNNALNFRIRLDMLFNSRGRPRVPLNSYLSNVLTPTGLPVENALCCHASISEVDLKVRPLKRNETSGEFGAPFEVSLPVPPDTPPGTYTLWLDSGNPNFNAPSRLGDVRAVRTKILTDHQLALPPFKIGDPAPPRLVWTMLTDVPSSDGSRGTIAIEDSSDFQIANRIASQSHSYVIPGISKETGEPITYRLEPYLPMIAQGGQDIPNVPAISFKLPSGSLSVRVTKPDGSIDSMGPVPFAAMHNRTPSTREGMCLDCGGPHLGDVLQLSTDSGLFDYQFTSYGKYTIEMTGTVDDVYGNTYQGGGTYQVYIAEPLDLEPAVLPMTPFQVGDVFHPGVTVLPGVPADVEVKVTLLLYSDPSRKVEYATSGRASRFGTFIPDSSAPQMIMTGPGEFLVETTARYTDADGMLWMGATRWGQVVETPGSLFIAHGRRGRDSTDFDEARAWFDEARPEGGRSHVHVPYHSGDVLWQTDDDSAIFKITAQDTEGLVKEAILARGAPNQELADGVATQEARVRASELPLNLFTDDGLNPAIFPDKITSHGYWYGAAQRPGERVREILSEDQPNRDVGRTYWRFGEAYASQPGVGVEGDRPNDFKFIFGGAVFRDQARQLNRYGIYSALWVEVPEDDPLGSRVFPPFQGANGGPNGGPIMVLDGEEIDAFVVPLAVRPGTILEVGDTFSFAAQLAPTLPAGVDIKVTGPDGFNRTLDGRANTVGYFYDPSLDFEVTQPGRYHVTVTATFDSPTSVGPMSPPYPTGTVLGAVDQGFDIYVITRDSVILSSPHPPWSAFEGVAPVPILIEPPEGPISGRAYYTIGMPGYLLEHGEVVVDGNYFTLEYDPIRLSKTFPNIDTASSRTRRKDKGLVDTIWVSVLVERGDRFLGRHFTLQGPDLYAPPGN